MVSRQLRPFKRLFLFAHPVFGRNISLIRNDHHALCCPSPVSHLKYHIKRNTVITYNLHFESRPKLWKFTFTDNLHNIGCLRNKLISYENSSLLKQVIIDLSLVAFHLRITFLTSCFLIKLIVYRSKTSH